MILFLFISDDFNQRKHYRISINTAQRKVTCKASLDCSNTSREDETAVEKEEEGEEGEKCKRRDDIAQEGLQFDEKRHSLVER